MRHPEDTGATPRTNRRILAWLESQDLELSAAPGSSGDISTSFAAGPAVGITTSQSQSALKRPVSTFSDSDPPNKRSRLENRHSIASIPSAGSFDSGSADSIPFCKETEWGVKTYYRNVCWLCQNQSNRTEICHVVQEQGHAFDVLWKQNIVPFKDFNSMDNAILLCLRCHEAFDEFPPQFILLPMDLKWFVDFEQRDYENRTILGKGGIRKARTVPTAEIYQAYLQSQGIMEKYPLGTGANELVQACSGGLYDAYIRRDFLSTRDGKDHAGLFIQAKVWHGSPTAALIHAASIIPRIDPNFSKPWIESGKREQLRELISMWNRPAPPVFDQPLDVPSGDNQNHTEKYDGGGKGKSLDEHKMNSSTGH
ncbi:hypothetical protein TWF281_011846 [Arthrobotrys megalospora]